MRILVVEDQTLIGKAMQKGLTEESFAVDWASCLADGRHLLLEFEYDTLILDLTLPDGSGLELLRELRATDRRTPVLILTAKDTLQDKALGFELGTDDYLAKPFAFEELLFRVRALIRRKYQTYGKVLQTGRLTVDSDARIAAVDGTPLSLTAKEFALLELLLLKRSKILSRQKILEHLYAGEENQESNIVDVFVNKLRRKLESAGVAELIETVRGEGYLVR